MAYFSKYDIFNTPSKKNLEDVYINSGVSIYIIRYLNIFGSNLHLFELFELIIKIIFIGHVFACMWHGVAFYNKMPTTWLTYYNLADSTIFEKYNYSLYWATMTMVTVGYGDVTGKN